MTRVLFLVVAVSLGAGQAPQRETALPPPSGTSLIAGIVVTDETNPVPIRRARVTVQTPEYGNGWSATTDDQGRFVVAGLPAGRFTVQAAKPAWLTASYGAAMPGRPGTPIVLGAGAQKRDVQLRMRRGGVITGTVLDRLGQPLPQISVAAMRFTYSEITGEKALVRQPGSAVTDDLGAFRIFGLIPGEYVVVASMAGGPASAFMELVRVTDADIQRAIQEAGSGAAITAPAPAATSKPPLALYGFAPVYFPSTVDASRASVIKLNAGEERFGVGIRFDLVASARVEAAITLPDGANPSSLQVFLTPQGAVPTGGALMTGRRDAEGRMIFAGVAPGAYTIIARAARAGATPGAGPPAGGRGGGLPPLTFYATVDIAVDGQDLKVPVDLREGLTVSGRVTFDDAGAAPRDHALTIGLVPLKAGPALTVPRVAVNPAGDFTIAGVPAGRYRIDYSAGRSMDSWALSAATAGGASVLDAPLEVRADQHIAELTLSFTNNPAELAGRLETPNGLPATEAYIIAFTPNQAAWLPMSRLVRQARPATDGTFAIRGLPPGDYLIAAVTDVEPGQWYDPAFLKELVPAAIRVSIKAGERTDATLRVR